MNAVAPRGRKSCARPLPGSLRQARLPQQSEVRLQARGVGEPDLAQGSDAKVRRRANQLADRLHGFFALAETSAAQREDAIGKGEIAVAVDRLARVRHGLLVPVGEQASQGEGEGGVVNEWLQTAEAGRLLGVL